VLKQPSAPGNARFPQRVVEKGDALAISPLADTPNRLASLEFGEDLYLEIHGTTPCVENGDVVVKGLEKRCGGLADEMQDVGGKQAELDDADKPQEQDQQGGGIFGFDVDSRRRVAHIHHPDYAQIVGDR
jgi:hypothetical protein